MDPRKPPEHILEIFADRASVKEIVKGALRHIYYYLSRGVLQLT